ncbi:hypothetical protein ACHWQZ_G011110 [Mnemiopsis leidyi]
MISTRHAQEDGLDRCQETESGLAEQLGRALRAEISQPNSGDSHQYLSQDSQNAPDLPPVAPELEVPDLLSDHVPLCFLEECFFQWPETASQNLVRSGSLFPSQRKEDKVPWRNDNLEYNTWNDFNKMHVEFQDRVSSRYVAAHDQGSVEVVPDSSLRALLTEPVWSGDNLTSKIEIEFDKWRVNEGEYQTCLEKNYFTSAAAPVPAPLTTCPCSPGEPRCAGHSGYYKRSSSERKAGKLKKRWRRKRTVFSPAEIAILEGVYEEHKFLNPTLKANILSRVNVSSNVVVMWFQNRRAKDRAAGVSI